MSRTPSLSAPPPDEEQARLAAVEGLHLLDTPREERFDRITRLALDLFGVSSAAVNLIARDRQWAKSTAGLAVGEMPRMDSFCELVVQQPDLVVVPDAREDPRFAHKATVTGDPHIRFYAGHPIAAPGGELVGTLCVYDGEPRLLTGREQTLLRELAEWAQHELARTDELDRAASVQRGLLPIAPPDLAGYDVAGACLQSREVGGDLYDWYAVPGGLVLAVCDVMGKGLAAAIMVGTVRAVLRAHSRAAGLVAAVEAVDEAMQTDFRDAAAFVTLFAARIDFGTGIVGYVDAGHGLALVVRSGGTVERLPERGIPAGAAPGASWDEGILVLADGDCLVCFSDGLLDLHPDGAAVEAAVTAAVAEAISAADVVERLVAPARTAGAPDDVTVLCLRRTTA